MTNGNTAKNLLISLTAIAVSLLGSAAYADSPKSDWFNRSTPLDNSKAMPPQPTRPPIQKTAERLWFEALDEQIESHTASEKEKFILTRSFGSPPQLERVVEWTNTASSVAKKYHELARYLNSTPIPESIASDPQANDLTTYVGSPGTELEFAL